MKTFNELQLAKELILYPSVTPIDAGVMKFLEKKLKKLGFKTKILEFKEKNTKPVKNIYARLGSKGPNFCYAGHLDVVPAGNLRDWTVNPFRPSIKKGHLIGRGANDMKSSIAAFVSAISIFIKNNKKFNGSISLLITGDEEGVAINGTKKVVEYLKKRKEKIDFCLVGEPTNPNKLGEMIKIGRRGSMNGRLSVIGIQGHVAYPHRANNPSTTLVQILKELKEIKFDKGTKDFQPTNLEITKINNKIEKHKGVFSSQGKIARTRVQREVEHGTSNSKEIRSEHKLVQTIDGRKAIYCSPGHIVDVANLNSNQKEFIDFLTSHQTKKDFSFSFAWKKGDIAVWSNRSMLHAATTYNGDRKMFRITVQ